MPQHAFISEPLSIALLIAGGLCAFVIRAMQAGPARGWTKLGSFLFIGSAGVIMGLTLINEQTQRSITSISASGTLVNLHTEPTGSRGSPTQHYSVATEDAVVTPDLHDQDGLFFMKAENGERVQLTYTKESGYVTSLRIESGPHVGYQFQEPDARNTTGGYFFILIGIALAITGTFKWIVDHNADPALAD
jgi:hypothetical protein